ncbi:hypothetical protein CFOL_v3_21171 [Cephalotus follicularis]|uniref:DUF7887 domain-containing protein n=1 Tax=Cephalotus follicularis TaxID=3775 RepID=A0A1Q3CBU5_CEPFO|nr:hypothetical protein CFOL_v3_21171 [Cephalotus follicularis]
MIGTQRSFVYNISCCLFGKTNGKKFPTVLAKGRDWSENSGTNRPNKFPLRLLSKTLLARSVVAVFGLGFIDAGYSGDWSRIGVISKESEELLKVAAFLVVPLCIFFIISISKEP